ncbi:MAG TPA: DUF2332 domain-containing protein [Alphaproteobacteria bacterium]|nr:DUF2332 domain-containing protein [Alphaproteobacteria bacterium]
MQTPPPEHGTLPFVPRDPLVTAFRLQAGGCRLFGSQMYARMMEHGLQDVLAGGPVARMLDGFEGDPVRGFLPLRLFGAVHARVLAGQEPELARYYPTAGGVADADAAWPLFVGVVEQHGDALRERLGRFPQTNEVRRCAGLLGGFLEAAHETRLPLRLREIGCSAGLNLQWSRYRYRIGDGVWGDPDSPVRLAPEWTGPLPRLETGVEIESRAGCDLDPPRLADDAAARTLESFVWADQPDRLEQLRAAIAMWRADPPRVDRARARDWLAEELADEARGLCTVVYHSSVWIYVAPEERAAIREILEARGARATSEDPIAWVRHEDGKVPGSVEIRVRVWPGGEERLLGMGHPHGREVEWRG